MDPDGHYGSRGPSPAGSGRPQYRGRKTAAGEDQHAERVSEHSPGPGRADVVDPAAYRCDGAGAADCAPGGLLAVDYDGEIAGAFVVGCDAAAALARDAPGA